jgi:SnoaL-like domain
MRHADDRWAINETLSLHGHIFDGGHLDRLHEIFTPEVIYDMSAVGLGTFEGIEMVRESAQKMEEAGVGPLAHHVTNVVITSDDGDVATAESKILMLMKNGGLESATQLDTLRRHSGGWRISHRVISPLRPVPEAAGGAHADER